MPNSTVDAGYKNSIGIRKIYSYNRYKLYSSNSNENRFPEDGSYIRNVLISGVLTTGIHCIMNNEKSNEFEQFSILLNNDDVILTP